MCYVKIPLIKHRENKIPLTKSGECKILFKKHEEYKFPFTKTGEI